jgi:hypothetical protein
MGAQNELPQRRPAGNLCEVQSIPGDSNDSCRNGEVQPGAAASKRGPGEERFWLRFLEALRLTLAAWST